LFSRYLQQLIMESLGKEKDLSGAIVHQGLSVYGNKGSTDQHAYVQQLRDGIANFFVVFVEALRNANAKDQIDVEPGVTSGDFLNGFFLGTRQALNENGRKSITVTIGAVDAFNVGMLIALFERFVGLYADMVGINAYHQPGVEAGKKAASEILSLQKEILDLLAKNSSPLSVDEIAAQLKNSPQIIFKILCHLHASNKVSVEEAKDLFQRRYGLA